MAIELNEETGVLTFGEIEDRTIFMMAIEQRLYQAFALGMMLGSNLLPGTTEQLAQQAEESGLMPEMHETMRRDHLIPLANVLRLVPNTKGETRDALDGS